MLERLPQYEYRITETKNVHALARQCLSTIDTAFAYSRYEASIVSPLITKSMILVMRYDSARSWRPRFGVVVCWVDRPESTSVCSALASTEDFNALLAFEGIRPMTMDMALEVARLYVRCLSLHHPYRFGCFFLEELPVLAESMDSRGAVVDSVYPSLDNFMFLGRRIEHWDNCKQGLACYASPSRTEWDDEYACVRMRKGGGYDVLLMTAGANDADILKDITCRPAWYVARYIMLHRWEFVVMPEGVSSVKITDISKRLKKRQGCLGSSFW